MNRVNPPTALVACLEEIFRTTGEVQLRPRVPIVLMAHRGRPRGEIATDLGCSRSSVPRWLNADLERGRDGLTSRKAKGAKPKLTLELAPVIRQWVIDGRAQQGWIGPTGRTSNGLTACTRPEASGSASRHSRRSGPRTVSDDIGRRIGFSAATRPNRQRLGRRWSSPKRAAAGELVLLNRDEVPDGPDADREARGEGAPTDRRDMGWQAPAGRLRRGQPGDGAVHANTPESPKDAKKKTGKSKTRRVPEAFAAHVRPVARTDPADRHQRLVVMIVNAPWHRGKPIDEALRDNPHLAFQRWPRDRPQWNPSERFGKIHPDNVAPSPDVRPHPCLIRTRIRAYILTPPLIPPDFVSVRSGTERLRGVRGVPAERVGGWAGTRTGGGVKIVITLDGRPDPTPVEVPDATTVADLIEAIVPDARPADVHALVNRRPEPRGRVLRPGDRVHLAWTGRPDRPD